MDERFTPRMFIEWRAKQEGRAIEDYGVAPVVVLSWHPETIQGLAKAIDAKIPEHWFYRERFPLYTGQIEGRPVSFGYVPVGAPGTVMMMEEMIVCGARDFIGLGWAGSLQPQAPVGTFIIPTACVSEEGTSAHYIDKGRIAGPSPYLANIIRESCKEEGTLPMTGTLWTTDAPYRELVCWSEAINVFMDSYGFRYLQQLRFSVYITSFNQTSNP